MAYKVIITQEAQEETKEPGTKAYLKQLETIKSSASIDHTNLGQGKNTNFQNIAA